MGMAQREGVGRTRHLDTGALWIQQKQWEERLKVAKVSGQDSRHLHEECPCGAAEKTLGGARIPKAGRQSQEGRGVGGRRAFGVKSGRRGCIALLCSNLLVRAHQKAEEGCIDTSPDARTGRIWLKPFAAGW